MFRDRREAGRLLGREIAQLRLRDPVVLALPRGGVPVGFEAAAALGAPLDIVIVRKIGAPGNPELAVAAVVSGDPPEVVVNRKIAEACTLSENAIAALVVRKTPELERRRAAYLGGRPSISVADRTVVLVDDGAATGTTMTCAVRAVRRGRPREIVVALPVASVEAAVRLEREADKVVILVEPPHLQALAFHYLAFHQLDDAEVVDLATRNAEPHAGRSRGAPDPVHR